MVLAKASPSLIVGDLPRFFQSFDTISNIQGLVEHRVIKVGAKQCIEVSFEDLRPFSDYVIIAAVNYTHRKDNKYNELYESLHSKLPWTLPVSTAPENLDVEWSRLTAAMKVVELRAAVRSEYVQVKAHIHYPPIRLPNEEELELEELVSFLESKTNSPALLRLSAFLEWWTGSDSAGTSKVRREFLYVESLYAAQSKAILATYHKSSFITNEEQQVMQNTVIQLMKHVAIALDLNKPLSLDLLPNSTEEGERLLFRFRSWYKGGQVIVDFEEQEKKR